MVPLLFLPLLVPGQTVELASIRGQVVNAVTGEPIRKATVVARYIEKRQLAVSTTTDAAGQFALEALEPGSWRLSAERNGFVASEYGARKPGRPGTMLVLAAGRNMTEVAVRLWPQGVITGRVLDEDGDPVRGASVQASRFRYNGPRKQLMTAGAANTNDLGEYRIFDLTPAKYIVTVRYRRDPPGRGTVDRTPGAQPDENYVTTYYPGTRDAAAAAQLDVTPGGQVRNIDVTLSKAHTVRVRGRLVGESPEGGRRMQVVLMSAAGGSQGAAASPNGEFEIAGVVPGSYVLMAYSGRGGRTSAVRHPIEVGNGNVEGVVLNMSQAVTLSGRVRVDGQGTLPAGRLLVRLQPYEQGSFQFGPLPNASVGADGAFKLDSTTPDRYRVMVAGVPEGYYVKSISSANLDVLAAGLDVGAAAPQPLDIVLSPNAGQITGTAQNAAAQEPARGVTVVLIPQDKERRDMANLYRATTTDAAGHFTFRSLVPGNYRVYSWEDVEYGLWFDPDFMQTMAGKGEPVTIGEGSRENVQVTVIPAD